MPPKALESFSFTAVGSDATAIYSLLEKNGFEKNSQGVKAFLIKISGTVYENASQSPEEDSSETLTDKVARALEAMAENPEITDAAIIATKKGAKIIGSLFKKALT